MLFPKIARWFLAIGGAIIASYAYLSWEGGRPPWISFLWGGFTLLALLVARDTDSSLVKRGPERTDGNL